MRKDPTHSDPNAVRFASMPGGQTGWSMNPDTAARANRFHHLQQAALTSGTASVELLAARLVLLDGVPPTSLKLIETARSTPYALSAQIALEWLASEPARIERRLLSSMTALAWTKATDGHQLAEPQGLTDALIRWLKTSSHYSKIDSPLSVLAGDQLCWIQERVPGPLVSHIAGQSVFCALPRSSWARLEAGQPIRLEDELEVSDVGASGRLVQATMDSESDATSMSLIRSAEDIFRQRNTVRIDGHIKRIWAQALGGLEGRLRRAHPAVGLAVGWGAHMCEAGTLDSNNPAANTVKRYALRAMAPLALNLKDLPPVVSRWNAAKLGALYTQVMRETGESARPEMSAAISSFQSFLEEWFDVPPVARSSGEWAPSAPAISANVLWPHEIGHCIRLCQSCEDQRLGDMAAACFWIVRENPVRIQDLLRLRIRNLHLFEDALGKGIEIEVVRDAGRGRLKTENSQRRLYVRDPQGINHLLALLQIRQVEVAPEQALLFGQRGDDTAVYRQAALHTFLNTLIKRVTGDPGLRFHHLRHTFISERVDAILCSVGYTDVNPLEMLAGDAGHASPYTTLRVYSHRYEHALRLWLDMALTSQHQISGQQAEAWLDVKANSLIQAARRSEVTLLKLVWFRLSRQLDSVQLGSVCADMRWGEIMPPTMSAPLSFTLSPAVVADALIRHSEGMSGERAAALLHVHEAQWQECLVGLLAWLNQLTQSLYPRKYQRSHFEQIGELFDILNADSGRLFSDRLSPLREHLSTHFETEDLSEAIASWVNCGRGDHIALLRNTSPRGLFRLLHKSGVPPRAVRIVYQSAVGVPASSQEDEAIRKAHADQNHQQKSMQTDMDLHAAVTVFQEEFGCQPLIETRAPRVDRPTVYLQITSHINADRTASAAACTGVLKAWLIAGKAYLLLNAISQGSHEPRS